MKYLLSILTLAILFLAIPSFATDTVEVDITKLTDSQLRVYQEMKAMQIRSATATAIENFTPEKVDKYAQMGKGLGIAINEGLGAITKNVEQFAQTSAGKWIMVLVTWKVMGEDAIGLTRTLVQYCVGITLFLVGIPFWIWLIRRNCVLRPIASVEKLGFWAKKTTYTGGEPLHGETIAVYGLFFLFYLGATALITFIH